MKLEKRAVKKWTIIVLVCGAHSFFWGCMAGNIPAMLLGLLTLILLYSAVESHPAYQAKRAANPLLAKALDKGVRIRMWLALYVVVTPLIHIGLSPLQLMHMPSAIPFLLLISLPTVVEVAIGEGAAALVALITGTSLEHNTNHAGPVAMFVTTYLVTVITAAAHSAILAVICGIVYGYYRLKAAKA